jgi:hypothetical protein
MLNLQRLQELRKSFGQNFFEIALKNTSLALTKRQWFGESHRYFFTWRKFIIQFIRTSIGKNFLHDAAENGLVSPRFYTKKGAWLCSSELNCLKFPYFFVDMQMAGEMLDASTSFFVPIGRDQNTNQTPESSPERIYNSTSKTFEPFAEAMLDEPQFSYIKASLQPYQPQEQPATNHDFARGKLALGFSELRIPHYDWLETFEGKMPYELGFLKLMLLTLGINNENEVLSESKQEYPIYTTIKKLVDSEKESNPWSSTFFKKEQFLQYALAQVFKNNPKLYQEAAQVVDITGLHLWQTYESITNGSLILYKDPEGTPYSQKELKRFLPGPHQTLAYFFMQALHLLWYGATSKKASAYYQSAGVQPSPTNIERIWLWWKRLNFSSIKQTAEKEINGTSFFSLWNALKRELTRAYPITKDWVSFDGHGWVITFDPLLIAQQRKIARERSCDYELLDKLGFAGIESWLGHELEVFYKK